MDILRCNSIKGIKGKDGQKKPAKVGGLTHTAHRKPICRRSVATPSVASAESRRLLGPPCGWLLRIWACVRR